MGPNQSLIPCVRRLCLWGQPEKGRETDPSHPSSVEVRNVQSRAGEHIGRDIHFCPNFYLFLSPDQRLYIVKNMCLVIYTYTDCVQTVYATKYTASETFINKPRAVLRFDWIFITGGAGLAVTGQIRDFGSNVLQISFQRGSSSSPSYFHMFFLIDCIHRGVLYQNIIFATH